MNKPHHQNHQKQQYEQYNQFEKEIEDGEDEEVFEMPNKDIFKRIGEISEYPDEPGPNDENYINNTIYTEKILYELPEVYNDSNSIKSWSNIKLIEPGTKCRVYKKQNKKDKKQNKPRNYLIKYYSYTKLGRHYFADNIVEAIAASANTASWYGSHGQAWKSFSKET